MPEISTAFEQACFIPIIIAAEAEDILGVLIVEGSIHPMDAGIEVIKEARGGMGQRFAGDEGVGCAAISRSMARASSASEK